MKSLRAEELLNVWEQGLNQPVLQRALMLLVAAFPDMQPDSLAKLSIGQRDLLLLQLRERLFGQQLLNTATCPECNERIEWCNSTADFLVETNECLAANNGQEHVFDLETGDYTLKFRLPNSLDIAALVNSRDEAESQQKLLSCCVLDIELSGKNCSVEKLPEAVAQTLIQRIEELDTQTDIHINLTCPECSHSWSALFDIASFIWVEVNDWAEQMLQMVAKLATIYGWSEREILNLNPVRRQLYLGMAGA